MSPSIARLLVATALAIACGQAAVRSQPTKQPVGTWSDPALCQELARRVEVDQTARRAIRPGNYAEPPPEFQRLVEVDRDNLAWFRGVIRAQGWPRRSVVGTECAEGAWLLAQHADADRDFQRRCLALMEPLVKEGEVDAARFAFLTDRVHTVFVVPPPADAPTRQIYGTQGYCDGGIWKPFPIEDEGNVDARRASVGLPPLAAYQQEMHARCGK